MNEAAHWIAEGIVTLLFAVAVYAYKADQRRLQERIDELRAKDTEQGNMLQSHSVALGRYEEHRDGLSETLARIERTLAEMSARIDKAMGYRSPVPRGDSR